MSKLLVLGACLALGACQFSTSVGGRGPTPPPTSHPSGQPSGTSRPMTMPNLMFMTHAEAEATLRRLGYEKELSIDDHSTCGSVVDGKIVELGRVCYQHPPPGKETSTTTPKYVRVQTENPYGGKLHGDRFWFLMPDLVGQHVDAARAKLKQLGFVSKEVKTTYLDGCAPDIVCKTYPEALTRTDNTSDKLFYIGAPAETPAPAPQPETRR